MTNMPDNKSIREFIQRHVGGSWMALCIEPERDESGSPVTIRPDYIGVDEAATHLLCRPMAFELAISLQKAISAIDPTCMPSVQRQNSTDTVLMLNIDKARKLAGNESFEARTHQRSLRDQIESGEIIESSRRTR